MAVLHTEVVVCNYWLSLRTNRIYTPGNQWERPYGLTPAVMWVLIFYQPALISQETTLSIYIILESLKVIIRNIDITTV